MQGLTPIKWHIYIEFLLFLLNSVAMINIYFNPPVILNLLISPKTMILMQLFSHAGTIWLGYLVFKVHKLNKKEVQG